MAKKKLNKKVAIAGSIFLVFVAAVGIWYISYKLQGPQKFIADGDAAVAAKDYQTALKQYGRAFARAKDNGIRKTILFKMADIHIVNDDWRKAIGCWSKITTIDTSDSVSRAKLLSFFYDIADAGQYSVWKQVLNTSDELLKISPQAKFYLTKGRAKLELARGGEVADRVQAFDETAKVLNEAIKLDPKNPNAYRYLAEAVSAKGEVLAAKASPTEKTKARDQAKKWLEKAIAVAPNDPNAYLQLLDEKMHDLQDKKEQKQIRALESEYVALTKKFPKNPDVFTGLAFFYMQDANGIDKSLKAAQKAMELSPQSTKYARNAAEICYRKGSLANDEKYIQKSIDIAKEALTFPDTKDTQSSREYSNKMNRLSLNTFLAYRYAEQLLKLPANATKQQKDALIAADENSVHEIAQIRGSGEDPYVLGIQGISAYARGDTSEGIKKMYTAYEQLKQADTQLKDAQLGWLSYMLADAFITSPEIGKTNEFLINAYVRGVYYIKPDILLAMANTFSKLRDYKSALIFVSRYEEFAKPTATSRLMRVNATAAAGQIDDAQALLAKMKQNDPNVMAAEITLLQTRIDQATVASIDANNAKKTNEPIQAEIDKYRDEQVKLAQKLLQSEPNATQALSIVCEYYVKKNKIQDAKVVVGSVLTRAPGNAVANFYRLLLAEPDPSKIAPQRKSEILEQAQAAIPNPVTRSMALADYYKSLGKFDKTIAEYKKVLEVEPANKMAISGIFEAALLANDLKLAEQFSAVAKRENVDSCNGEVFAARLAVAKKDYKDALNRLEGVIKQRPIFSFAYLLRSGVQSDLGNDVPAVEDARKAVEINPLDGLAAKNLANLLYQRNRKLGQKVTTEQVAETRAALEHAFAANPREWQILSFYAEYISDTEPAKALAIRQQIQSRIPTVENAASLGNLAVKMAMQQRDAAQRNGYLEIAASAYEQGYKLDSNNSALLSGYANYYTVIGKPDQATQLLNKTSNKNLLWVYQIQKGQFPQAKEVLDKLYQQNPKDVNVIKGLLVTSQNLGDAQAVTKFSQELLSFDNTPENQLGQIEAFLQVGLVDQADKKLAGFMEKYPNDSRTISIRTQIAIKKGQFTEALTLLELNPNDAVSLNLKGQIEFWRGEYAAAIDDFKKAKSISPTLQGRINLARAYLRAGRGSDAVNEIVLAIDTAPEYIDLYFMLEDAYAQLNRTDALNRFYADTIKKFPGTPFWYNRAAAFAISQKNYDNPETGAVALSKKALELSQKANPNISKDVMTGQARMALANYLQVMLDKKQYDQLNTYAAQYVDSDIAYVAFLKMADAKVQMGDKSAAIGYYDKALQKCGSEDSVIVDILNRMTDAVGRDEAIKWCTAQLKTTPNSLPVNLAMCNLYHMNKENNKALVFIDKCLQLTDSKSQIHRTFLDTKQAILVELYNSTSDDKYFSEAIKLYEDYVAGSSGVEVGALNNLAYLLASNDRDIDKALGYIKRAYDAVQNNPNILDTYAYVLYKKGDYKKASEIVLSAMQLFEKSGASADPAVYEHSGMISAKLGHKNEAVNAYNQALKIGDKTLSDAAKQRIKTAIGALK